MIREYTPQEKIGNPNKINKKEADLFSSLRFFKMIIIDINNRKPANIKDKDINDTITFPNRPFSFVVLTKKFRP